MAGWMLYATLVGGLLGAAATTAERGFLAGKLAIIALTALAMKGDEDRIRAAGATATE